MGLGSLLVVLLVGRLLVRGFSTGRMVTFHYMAHEAEWKDNRFGYLFATGYNLACMIIALPFFLAAVVGRFE